MLKKASVLGDVYVYDRSETALWTMISTLRFLKFLFWLYQESSPKAVKSTWEEWRESWTAQHFRHCRLTLLLSQQPPAVIQLRKLAAARSKAPVTLVVYRATLLLDQRVLACGLNEVCWPISGCVSQLCYDVIGLSGTKSLLLTIWQCDLVSTFGVQPKPNSCLLGLVILKLVFACLEKAN